MARVTTAASPMMRSKGNSSRLAEQSLSAITILDARRIDVDGQQQAERRSGCGACDQATILLA